MNGASPTACSTPQPPWPLPNNAARFIAFRTLAEAECVVAAVTHETAPPLALLSDIGAGQSLGALWFAALQPRLHRVPLIIDCADFAGAVMACLHHGLRHFVFTGNDVVAQKLTEQGAMLWRTRPPAFELWRYAPDKQQAALQAHLTAHLTTHSGRNA